MALCEKCEALRGELAVMRAALGLVQGIVNESRGVVGYHLNGAIADWDELGVPAELSAALATDAGKAAADVLAAVRNMGKAGYGSAKHRSLHYALLVAVEMCKKDGRP